MSSPDKRNLTDELQSVLRAHALDAPEPASSIEQVLALTVGKAAAEPDPVAPSPHRWFAPRRLVMVGAAAAVVVAAGIALPKLLPQHTSRQSTASDSSLANGALRAAGTPSPSSPGFSANGGAAAGVAAPEAASAPPVCSAQDLSVSLVTTGVHAPAVASIRVTNRSARSCLISGFPAVDPMGPTLNSMAMSTPGPTAETVPTLVLAPGTSASSAVDANRTSDSAYQSSACSVTSLAVTMPSGAQAQFPFRSSQCSFSVHPLMPEQK